MVVRARIAQELGLSRKWEDKDEDNERPEVEESKERHVGEYKEVKSEDIKRKRENRLMDILPFKKVKSGYGVESLMKGARDFREKECVKANTSRNWNGYEDEEMKKALKDIFGKNEFRPGQAKTIHEAGLGRDVFVLMPTGAGKSLCYQLPACLDEGLTIVISPLLSLIEDQVAYLQGLGIRAKMLSSTISKAKQEIIFTLIMGSKVEIKLLYVTPEAITNSKKLRHALKFRVAQNMLARFVIDEAHCIDQWGHDFRKDYQSLCQLRITYPTIPIMALTATANAKIEQDIIELLHLKSPWIQRSSFNRPNFSYTVHLKFKKYFDDIKNFLVNRPHQSGIIYCTTHKECEELTENLTASISDKHTISYYHAGLENYEKSDRHVSWQRGDISVMIATIAFGMGIDKPDVRFVIHHSLPKSITHFYQESGRAGRDGLPAESVIYYSYEDFKQLLFDKGGSNRQAQIKSIRGMMDLCQNNVTCRRELILRHFGENIDDNACKDTCDSCKAKLDNMKPSLVDITEISNAIWTMCTEFLLYKTKFKFLCTVSHCMQNNTTITLLDLVHLCLGHQLPKKKRNFIGTIPGFGIGKAQGLSNEAIKQIIHFNIYKQYVVQIGKVNHEGYAQFYMKLGSKWAEWKASAQTERIMMQVSGI
ncbi:bloom syndrome protein [Thraustotheca clavata]|uniref:ATP-dependent DNA helicase n=1 Tax=Thraustotheca clavata TaxID=74557 RepID=A0A1V9ZZ97_9STRA|nr:bloom syndrome protein [Thraustotheca clavata]